MSIHLKNMLARRSLPSLKTRISVDWKKKILMSLMFASLVSPMLAMEPVEKFNKPNQHVLDNALTTNRESAGAVKHWLEQGANPDARCSNGFTVLQNVCGACFFDTSQEICRLLIDHGANPEITFDNGDSCLIRLARNGRTHECRLLVSAYTARAKTKCIVTFLLCMKQIHTGVLYQESRDLFRQHLQKMTFRPLELLQMKSKGGKTAHDFLRLSYLKPDEEPARTKVSSSTQNSNN